MSKPVKLGGNCPICGGTSKKRDCVQIDSTVHCRLQQEPNDSRWVPSVKNGFHTLSSSHFWVYVPRRKKTNIDFDRESWTKQKAEREAIEDQKALDELSPLTRSQRSLEAKKLLDGLDLAKADLERLKKRGLSDSEIEKRGFRSIREHQLVHSDVSTNLPGIAINRERQKYLSTLVKDGFLVPIWNDFTGDVLGFQIRDNDPKIEQKYKWLKSRYSSHLNVENSKELPIAVIEPARLKDFPWLVFSEGTLKPLVAAQRWGHYFLGASGGYFSKSPNQVKQALNKYQEIIDELIDSFKDQKKKTQKGIEHNFYQNEKLIIRLAVDAGDVFNPAVIQRLKKQVKFLESLDLVVLILWWGQSSKKANDCDEVSEAEILTAKEIYPSEFFEKAKNKQVIKDLEKFTPDQTITSPFVENILESIDGIIAIKSGLGTGKTREIVRYILSNWAEFSHYKIIFLGYRNSLLQQTISDLNIALKALGSSVKFEMLNELDNEDINDNYHVALCVDSIGKVEINLEIKTIIFIDEINSILKHLYHAQTHVKIDRVKNVDRYWQVINKAKQVILTDGNLTDRDINLFRIKCPYKAIYKILNDFKVEKKAPINIHLGTYKYEKNQASTIDIRPILRKVAETVKDSKKIVFGTDSQKMAESLDYMLSLNPRLKVFRLDGKTSNKDPQLVFLEDPDTYIRIKELDALIFTTSAESGLNISGNHFDHAFYVIHGTNDINPVNSVAQLMNRIRADIPIDIFVKPVGISFRNMGDTFTPDAFKTSKRQDFEERLYDAVFSIETIENKMELVKKIAIEVKQNIADADDNFCADNHFIAKIQSRNLREYVINYLQENVTNPLEFYLADHIDFLDENGKNTDGLDGKWIGSVKARNEL